MMPQLFNQTPFVPEEHYHLLVDWWTKRGWPVIPVESLPRTGFVFSQSGIPLLVGFVLIDRPWAMIELFVSNPETSQITNVRCLVNMFDFFLKLLKHLGCTTVITICKDDTLVRFTKKLGFATGDENVTHMVARL